MISFMDATQTVLNIFEQLSAIPRGSGNEVQISQWLQDRAAAQGFSSQTDEAGNLVIRVPATPGYESEPCVVLQGHMDMVCEKTPDSAHDFMKDPIRCFVEGDWLHADHTTLGADNGIAIALALALVEDSTLAHPALELLFTVEEEVGLGGANLLKPGFITGKILLNLDSEDEGAFIVGCAGGQRVDISLPLVFAATPLDAAFHLKVSGLQGGHSGVDIHKHRASANQLLARVLGHIKKVTPLALCSLNGGTAHNAISREAEVVFACDLQHALAIQQAVRDLEIMLNSEYSVSESGITLTLTATEVSRAAKVVDSARVIQLLKALPHGVAEMSASVPGFVETSNNLARIEIVDDMLKVVTSQRSNVMTRIQALSERIAACGTLAGGKVVISPAYPGWQPDMNSPLLQRSVATYSALFGSAPGVRMIHAGLECGTIGAIFSGMDMISLGATIENPHSPAERLNIPSLTRVWRYLVAFLAAK
jgi:dipeptidase D